MNTNCYKGIAYKIVGNYNHQYKIVVHGLLLTFNSERQLK